MGEQLSRGSSVWSQAGATTRRRQNAHPRTQNRMKRHGRALFRVCLLPVFGPRVRGFTPNNMMQLALLAVPCHQLHETVVAVIWNACLGGLGGLWGHVGFVWLVLCVVLFSLFGLNGTV